MTPQEACVQAFENGRKKGDAEGYARGKSEAFAEAGDLISRKALLEKQYNASRSKEPSMAEMVVDVRDIKDAPAVASRPVKRGRWEPDIEVFDADPAVGVPGGEFQTGWKCSVCGRCEPEQEPYCHCGADMRGEGDA